ncbi:MAG: PKD domain-containing protein [Thermoplasmata archaeon]|nr:PKD domain-containing protein [Thermoplasmata archaeon]
MSTVVAALAIVVVLVIMGVGTFAFMGGFSKVGPNKTCEPANSPICANLVNLHDVSVLVPFKSVQANTPVPFTAQLPAGESSGAYTFYYGDGNKSAVTSLTTQSHTYSVPGIYLIYAEATVNGLVHNNIASMVQVIVTSTFASSTAGETPGVSGAILGNSTSASANGATAILQPFQTVTVSGSYSSAPTNPAFTANPPKIILAPNPAGSGYISKQSGTNISANATASFNASGTYLLTFVGSASNGTSPTVYENYSWTVFVAKSGEHAALAGTAIHTSPHPGTIISYELAPGGAAGEDPAIDYETVGAEAIYNVYQPLIMYNGTQTGPGWENFVPVVATCVPGSPQCQNLYGSTLVNGWNYTFVIGASGGFYDPATKASWGVWPSDVLFSYARTIGFANLPCVTCNPGWIQTQALLSSGNVTWDSIHGAYNNTPQNVFNAITVNGTDCPALALSQEHGCVTFSAYGNHHIWPYFLELTADPLGGAIVPCGWFSAQAQGAAIPYWTAGNVSGPGDHPCPLPGSPGYGVAPSATPATGWDHWEQLGSGAFGSFAGHVQFNMVGSGPYALTPNGYLAGSSYTLQANPAYAQNPHCTWTGCQPKPGSYAGTVEVTWETTATPGEQAYAAGVADFASIPGTDLALLIQLISQGKVTAISSPTLTVSFVPFDMSFDLGKAQQYTTQTINVPTDWFSYMGMREFFSRAYPYATVQNTITTKDGIQGGFLMGGAIPQFMANYYPKDIPWPSTDPCTDNTNPTCPAYWWTQMQQVGGPYYDPQVAACTSANPCQLPIFGLTGNPTGDQVNTLWEGELSALSGGAVKVNTVDVNFVDLLIGAQFSGPGQNPFPFYGLGWAPDYPDPTDYVVPLYTANATYTYDNSVIQSLLTPGFSNGCTHNTTDYTYYSSTTFPQSCQGVAYKAMLTALNLAAITPAGPVRVSLYDMAEKIAYQLCLYVYTGQSNLISAWASWVDSSSVNTNVTIGGGGDTTFFWLTGNSLQFPGST